MIVGLSNTYFIIFCSFVGVVVCGSSSNISSIMLVVVVINSSVDNNIYNIKVGVNIVFVVL